jgi:hypothetical protein
MNFFDLHELSLQNYKTLIKNTIKFTLYQKNQIPDTYENLKEEYEETKTKYEEKKLVKLKEKKIYDIINDINYIFQSIDNILSDENVFVKYLCFVIGSNVSNASEVYIFETKSNEIDETEKTFFEKYQKKFIQNLIQENNNSKNCSKFIFI